MKQPKKPTYQQKKVINRNGLDWKEWMVVRQTGSLLELISKKDGKKKTLEA